MNVQHIIIIIIKRREWVSHLMNVQTTHVRNQLDGAYILFLQEIGEIIT